MFEVVLSIIFMLFLLFVFIYAIKKISIIEKEIDSSFEEEQDYLLAFLGEEKYAEYQEWKRENKIE
jgi:hypothetical protein